jgi:hypothetical protein
MDKPVHIALAEPFGSFIDAEVESSFRLARSRR